MTAAMVKEHQYDRILWLLGDVDILYYNAVGGGGGVLRNATDCDKGSGYLS